MHLYFYRYLRSSGALVANRCSRENFVGQQKKCEHYSQFYFIKYLAPGVRYVTGMKKNVYVSI